MDRKSIYMLSVAALGLITIILFLAMGSKLPGMLKLYTAPVVGLVTIGAEYYHYNRYQTKQTAKVKTKDADIVRAYVYDIDRCSFNLREITPAVIQSLIKENGTLGRQWNYYGEKVYRFTLKGGEYVIYSYVPPQSEYTDKDLEYALNQDDIPLWYRPESDRGLFEKYGQVMAFALVVIFIMFLAVSK